jgi:poly-gamma-glutamate capsule biosynthesis protein CapA/YwtB (metallophosphatase superfamily)
MAQAVTLLGCGDVGPIHAPVNYGSLVRDTLLAADIRFAQVERVYSNRGALVPHSGGGHSRVPPEMASIFTDCGFNIVSVASNHAMDWGAEALLDTIELLRGYGIATIGAGRNLAEARQPAFIDCNGLRIAFLAYCSILHDGYAADTDKPGVAPLRAHTRYEPASISRSRTAAEAPIIMAPPPISSQHRKVGTESARQRLCWASACE